MTSLTVEIAFVVPEYVDFFNGGQKVYFWAIVASAVPFLVSGVPMWFPRTFGRPVVAIGCGQTKYFHRTV